MSYQPKEGTISTNFWYPLHDYIMILCFHILDLLPELKLFFLSENEYILLN